MTSYLAIELAEKSSMVRVDVAKTLIEIKFEIKQLTSMLMELKLHVTSNLNQAISISGTECPPEAAVDLPITSQELLLELEERI